MPSAGVRCSSGGASSSGSEEWQSGEDVFKGFRRQPEQRASPADALQNTLAAVSKNVDRVSKATNVILDTSADEDKWRELDSQVNEYPGQRSMKAIGTGDQDFVDSMTRCVESVVGTVHTECIKHRLSSNGKYVSVTVDVWVETPDQMLQIYKNMQADTRLRFFF